MREQTYRTTVVLAPGGPGLGVGTLAALPLPGCCKWVYADSACNPSEDPIARQTVKLIELIGVAASSGNVILIGHSAGAWSSIRAASQVSGCLAAVVLIAAQLRDRIDQPTLLNERLRALNEPSQEHARHAQSLSTDTVPLEESVLLDLLIADMMLTLPAIGPAQQRFLDSCRDTWNLQAVREHLARPTQNDLETMVGQIETPMLVINGEQDPWAGAASAKEIKAAARHCTVETILGAGHVPWLDNTDEFARHLTRIVEDAGEK